MKHRIFSLAAAGGLAICAFLPAAPASAQSARVDAADYPATDSTPAEKAETAQLNNQVTAENAAVDAQAAANDAQYRRQQRQYRNRLRQNQAAQARYDAQSAQYAALRERYRAAYHHGIRPSRHERRVLERPGTSLIGSRVEIINGDHVGTVREVAHNANRTVAAVLVRLDDGPTVWIAAADIRYNSGEGILMTSLDARDLRRMAEERM